MTADTHGGKSEIEALRDRVVALESELVRVEAWAAEAVASAQERTYWLDRWHLDLNAIMRHPAADRVRRYARRARRVYRWCVRVKRRLVG